MQSTGYSGTPLGKKLGIKPGHTVWLWGGPVELGKFLGDEISATYVSEAPDGLADVILLFAISQADFEARFDAAKARLAQNGGLWACWPKKGSGIATDLTENPIRDFGLACGLVDNKVCAVDATWSGLRFVVRVKDRI
jgi:hypothetical protein